MPGIRPHYPYYYLFIHLLKAGSPAVVEQFHGTTIVCARTATQVALGGDGQVSLGQTIMKGNARKVRRVFND